ncbi:hypothetical protein M407DRAFT_49351, partial [Tulasnella calospora MUT 4182]
VQAVPKPPAHFFTEVVRRRTAPLYRHPCLHAIGSGPGQYTDPEDGSITDGDDHEGLGGTAMLTRAVRDENGAGGWADVLSGAAKGTLKRKRVGGETEVVGESHNGERRRRIESDTVNDSEAEEEEGESNERRALTASIERMADTLETFVGLVRRQLPHENVIWMRNIRAELNEEWEEKASRVIGNIRAFERSGTTTTWPRNAKERQASKHTMGYQLQSTR